MFLSMSLRCFQCVADEIFQKKMGDETFVIDNETFVIGYK